jgi:hypothetical protein
MGTSMFMPLVVFSRLAHAIGLHLPSASPDDSQNLPKFASNDSSIMTEFEQWRFGDSAHDTNRVGNHGKQPKMPPWTASPEIMKRCAASVLTRMPESRVEKDGTGASDDIRPEAVMPDLMFTDKRLTDFLDNVDRIYVICMSCTRDFPAKLKHKVTILNGRLSDECFSQYEKWAPGKDHHRRVTFAHRLAITDAQANNFRLALVLEEDVIFKEDLQHFDFEPIAALIHDATRQWEVLRLTWWDRINAISDGCQAENVRKCNQWVEQNTCTIPSCDLHSSGAYIIPDRSYERFLTEGWGSIDGEVLNQFTQTVLTPTICHQDHHMTDELTSENLFMERCKGV